MKPLMAAVALLMAAQAPAFAQSAAQFQIAVEARTEGKNVPEGAGARLFDEVRRGLEAIGDVQVVPPEQAPRILSIVAGAGSSPYAAAALLSERYDRETLMVLGVEDDDLAV